MEAEKLAVLKNLTEEWIPFNKQLGLEFVEAEDGMARVKFDFRPELVGNAIMKILHGGVISATLDFVGGLAVMSTFVKTGKIYGMGTVDMRVDYLNPGAGKRFFAQGTVMRSGRILCSTRMELHNDEDQLIATGNAVYRVSRKEEAVFMNV